MLIYIFRLMISIFLLFHPYHDNAIPA